MRPASPRATTWILIAGAVAIGVAGCGLFRAYDLEGYAAAGTDGGASGAGGASGVGGASGAAADAGGGTGNVCNTESCNTNEPCMVATCEGDLCVIRPGCEPGEECCGSACVPKNCSDGVECTVDTCGVSGCQHSPDDAACDPGSGGWCDPDNGCQYPECTTANCAGTPCEAAACDSQEQCIRTPLCATTEECCQGQCVPIDCDDQNECTDDTCGASGCEHTANSASCDDGDPCNGPDRCSATKCAPLGPQQPDGTNCGTNQASKCCAGACTNTSQSPNHCGGCGIVCPSGVCEATWFGKWVGACKGCGAQGCPAGFLCRANWDLCDCNFDSQVCATGQTCIVQANPNALRYCWY